MFCSQCGNKCPEGAGFCNQCGNKLVSPAAVQVEPVAHFEPVVNQISGAPTAVEQRYAGFWFRVLAALIDGVISQVAIAIIVFVFVFSLALSLADSMSANELEGMGGVVGAILGMIIQWLWFTIAESSKWQATLGKKLLGLKVVDEHGQRISFARANGRYWSKILSAIILLIGFLMVAFTKKKQGLHDVIASTYVVKS